MNTIHVGAVGLGRLGWLHAENLAFRIPGARLKAVCSLVDDELVRARNLSKGVLTFTSFEEMLDKADLDAVVLSSPSTFHCEQITSALQKGVHVFCEKPLGTDPEECKRTAQVVHDHPHLVFMLGFMRRYDPSYKYVKDQIQAGLIGRPVLFRGYSVDPVSAIDGALAYAPHSAGQFLDMAVHDIDLARWYLGDEPTSVYAIGGCYAFPEFGKYGDGDNVSALMRFKNDGMAFLLAGRTAPHGYNVETEIIGTKATLRVGSVPALNKVEILDQEGVRQVCEQTFIERFGAAYLAELEEFISCIQERRQPEIKVEDGVAATVIALAATQSFKNNELIHL